MDFGIYMTGACGPSQALYLARNEEKRGRGSAEAVDKQIVSDTETCIQQQKDGAFDFVTDPQFRFYDLLQPLVETISGITAGPQENWFNNNVFYRRPLIHGPISPPDTGIYEPYLHRDMLIKNGPAMAVLPSPYTLFRLSDVSGYQNDEDAVRDLAALLRCEAQKLADRGFSRIQFDEPALVMQQSLGTLSQRDRDLCKMGIETIGTIKGAGTCLHTYFGNAGPLLPFLCDLPVDGIGIDCTETPMSDIINCSMKGKELSLGLVDARTPAMENPDTIREKVRQVAEALQPTKLWLTPNTGLVYIGWTLGNEKLSLLETAKKGSAIHA